MMIVLVVARVVTNLQQAREEARRREEDAARLFELSKALIGDLNQAQLLDHIVATVQAVFEPRWTALVLPDDDGSVLAVAARARQDLTGDDLASLTSSGGEIRSLGMVGRGVPSRAAVALVASNRPVGLLVLQEVRFARQDRALLETFANQAALAVERAQLRDQVLRSRLLEEIRSVAETLDDGGGVARSTRARH